MAELPPLSLDSLPAWARLHDVSYHDVGFESIEGKGFGLVAASEISSVQPENNTRILLQIPRDLVLSRDAVDDYAKVDQNFKQLLEAAGNQSPRRDILLYLLNHLVLSRRSQPAIRGAASTPWTEYTKFLARKIPVPTMWSDVERQLLQGTSLESALVAKLSALQNEFDELREASSKLPFWNALFWDKDEATLDDWILVDAWYRSRCLELPQSGDSMVPVLDMVNHSEEPTAYYVQDADSNVQLCLRPGFKLAQGVEINISYGASKPAAEMLFSYGFIDKHTTVQELTLHVGPLPDDPLAKAKAHIYGQPGFVKFSASGDSCEWQSPFAYLACLNEEDGLEFRVLQDKEDNRQLRLFWHDDDVTTRAHDLEALVKTHPLYKLFMLRVVTIIHGRAAEQLEEEQLEVSTEEIDRLCESGDVRREAFDNTILLRNIEIGLLEKAVEALEAQRSELLEDEDVLAYLRGADDAGQTAGQSPTANEEVDEDDFS